MKKISLCVLALICLLACEERDEIVINNIPVAEEPQDTTGDPDPPTFRCYKPDSTAEIIEGTFMEAAFDYVHNRLLIALRDPNRVLIYDLEANQKHEIQLSEAPTKITVIPMGTAFAVASTNNIFHYNLNSRILRGTYPADRLRDLVFSNFIWIYYNNASKIYSIDARNQQTYSLRRHQLKSMFLGPDQNTLYMANSNKIEKIRIHQGSQATTDTSFRLSPPVWGGYFFQTYNREFLVGSYGRMFDLVNTEQNLSILGTFSHANFNPPIRGFSANDSLNEYYLVGEDIYNNTDTLINVFKNFQYQRTVRIPRIQHQGICYTPRTQAIFYYPKANQILAITESVGPSFEQDILALVRVDL